MGGVGADVGGEHALRWRRLALRWEHNARYRTPGTRTAVRPAKRPCHLRCPGLVANPRGAEWAADADACEHHVASALDRGAAAMMKRSSRLGALCIATLAAAACGGK